MLFVHVKLAEGVYTEKQKRDMTAKLTDVMVAFEGPETFHEGVWVLIEELHRNGWHIEAYQDRKLFESSSWLPSSP